MLFDYENIKDVLKSIKEINESGIIVKCTYNNNYIEKKYIIPKIDDQKCYVEYQTQYLIDNETHIDKCQIDDCPIKKIFTNMIKCEKTNIKCRDIFYRCFIGNRSEKNTISD